MTAALAPNQAETFALAMGATAHVRVLGPEPEALLAHAFDRIAELEARWSRFRPTSDVSRANLAAGRPVAAAEDTLDLVELAVAAWELTGGRFDPTVLPAVVAAGYDRSFEQLAGRPPARPGPAVPAPGCAGIALDRAAGTLRLPAGAQLDLGGIGKGRAADLVATELVGAGAAGACVNLGGDVRVAGAGPDGGRWLVTVQHPLVDQPIVTLALAEGAVATSTTIHRRWATTQGSTHHLIDPATGAPTSTDLLAVTVVGRDAAWAEAVAKAALVAGRDAGASLVAGLRLTGLLVDADGTAWTLPGLEELLA